jgi:transcriptional regulator of acetoin/glycerol metabolism
VTDRDFRWLPLTNAHEIRRDFREALLRAQRVDGRGVRLDCDDVPIDSLWAHSRPAELEARACFTTADASGALAIARSAIEEASRELPPNDPLASCLRQLAAGAVLRVEAHFVFAFDDRRRPCLGWVADWSGTASLLAQLTRLASETLPVLIVGESGTGKELVARGVHTFGRRRDLPYLAINCAELPESVLESELFGHTRGAFTGATTDRPGLFETAANGTVFLDEIGELPIAAQAKLLRVLEEHRVRRIGAAQPRPLGCRIVAATNRDLVHEIARGRFRTDLYYRLRGSEVRLVPLRERRQDVLPLAESFLGRASLRFGKRRVSFASDARLALLAHDWPGNIRELRHAVDIAVLGAAADAIDATALSLVRQPAAATARCAEPLVSVSALERAHILRALASTDGNKMAAARILGITRQSLQRRIVRHGIVLPPGNGRPGTTAAPASGYGLRAGGAEFEPDAPDVLSRDDGTERAPVRET